MRLPPAVILTRLRSIFLGRYSTIMFAYVTVRSSGIYFILLLSRTNSEFFPLVPVLVYPCDRFPHSFTNDVVQTSLVAGSFANLLYLVIYLPVKGCITGAHKCSNGVVVSCVGIEIAFVASCVM